MLQEHLASSARCGRAKSALRPNCAFTMLLSSQLGSETWATTQTEEKKLDVFDNCCLRRILGIMWFHHVRNTEVRERTGQTPASLLLKSILVPRATQLFLNYVSCSSGNGQKFIFFDWPIQTVCAIT